VSDGASSAVPRCVSTFSGARNPGCTLASECCCVLRGDQTRQPKRSRAIGCIVSIQRVTIRVVLMATHAARDLLCPDLISSTPQCPKQTLPGDSTVLAATWDEHARGGNQDNKHIDKRGMRKLHWKGICTWERNWLASQYHEDRPEGMPRPTTTTGDAQCITSTPSVGTRANPYLASAISQNCVTPTCNAVGGVAGRGSQTDEAYSSYECLCVQWQHDDSTRLRPVQMFVPQHQKQLTKRKS
jgi:hypothetical protein